MNTIRISTPIWSGAGHFDSPCIGIRCDRVKGYAKVTIDYTDRHGNKTYPGEFGITKKQAEQYPKKKYSWGLAYLIPISELRQYVPKKGYVKRPFPRKGVDWEKIKRKKREDETISIKEAMERGYLKI